MGLIREYHKHSKRVTSTRRWQVLRHAVLERDGWACVDCGTRKGRLEIDHVKPVRSNPELAFDPANCAVRCSSCHASKTRKEMGWPPVFNPPAKSAWGKAVAELAANPNPAT